MECYDPYISGSIQDFITVWVGCGDDCLWVSRTFVATLRIPFKMIEIGISIKANIRNT